MVTVKRNLEWIMPIFPVRKVGTFSFVRPSVTNQVRASALLHHGEATICPTHRKSGPHFYWEQEVYEDARGERWVHDPQAKTRTLNGWRRSKPCSRCADSDLDAILASRLDWQERGSCWGTEYPGFMESTMTDEIRNICAMCPVELQCRSYGRRLHRTTLGGTKGILGGETESQRNAHQSS